MKHMKNYTENVERVGGSVTRVEETRYWFRCDICRETGGDPDEIVHSDSCPLRERS